MTQRRLSGEVIRTDGDPLLDISSIPQPPAWTVDALCAQVDLDGFFPDKGGSTKHAKAICGTCPVIHQCLQYALDNEERFGIWGGTSERERRRILKAIAEAAGPTVCGLGGCDEVVPTTSRRPRLYCSDAHGVRAGILRRRSAAS